MEKTGAKSKTYTIDLPFLFRHISRHRRTTAYTRQTHWNTKSTVVSVSDRTSSLPFHMGQYIKM